MRWLLLPVTLLLAWTVGAQTLYPPTGVTALARSATEVTISWNPAANAKRYKVRNKTTGRESFDIFATSHVETGLTTGRQYCFTVITCGDPGNCSTAESPQVCAVPTTPPSPPVGVAASVASASSIRITWNATANATRYKVRNVTTGAQTQNDILTTTYEWTGLPANSTYCFQVLACNVPGICSAPSAQSCVNLPPTPAPPVLSAATESSSSIRLSWAAVANATRYKVTNVTTGIQTGDLPSNSYLASGLSPGMQYCFTAIACNVQYVCGAPSAPSCAYTSAAPSGDAFAFPAGPEDGAGWRGTSGLGFLETHDYGGTCGVAPHPGFDINKDNAGAGDKGEPVYATAAGEVVEAHDYGGSWGKVILIKHPGANVWSQYGHLETMTVTKGQTVGRRTPIGTVGDANGMQASPHLHFEIRIADLLPNAFPCGQNEDYVRARYTDPIAYIDSH